MIKVEYCPHPVTVYIRGPIKGYNRIILIIQLLLRGGGGGAVPKIKGVGGKRQGINLLTSDPVSPKKE